MSSSGADAAAASAASIDADWLRSLVDFGAVEQRVRERLQQLDDDAALLRFFVRYASWNGAFAGGVAALTSLVSRQRDLFREPGYPHAASDRANYIASFFFDAARDEYDDHINPERDSHRCMAQASLLAMREHLGLPAALLDEPEPPALQALNDGVLDGYTGARARAPGSAAQVFAAIGYHLGSELLADREFSLLDEHLRGRRAALFEHLKRATVPLAGTTHRCYAWVGVHSGHGGGVEADHFDHACAGARLALRYLTTGDPEGARAALAAGFRAFDADHATFFAIG